MDHNHPRGPSPPLDEEDVLSPGGYDPPPISEPSAPTTEPNEEENYSLWCPDEAEESALLQEEVPLEEEEVLDEQTTACPSLSPKTETASSLLSPEEAASRLVGDVSQEDRSSSGLRGTGLLDGATAVTKNSSKSSDGSGPDELQPLCCNKVKLSPWNGSMIHANTPLPFPPPPTSPPSPLLPPSHPSLHDSCVIHGAAACVRFHFVTAELQPPPSSAFQDPPCDAPAFPHGGSANSSTTTSTQQLQSSASATTSHVLSAGAPERGRVSKDTVVDQALLSLSGSGCVAPATQDYPGRTGGDTSGDGIAEREAAEEQLPTTETTSRAKRSPSDPNDDESVADNEEESVEQVDSKTFSAPLVDWDASTTAASVDELGPTVSSFRPQMNDIYERNLEVWRMLCVDFYRFRHKCPDRVKALIRRGLPEFLRGAVWQQLSQSRELREKHSPNLYDTLKNTPYAP